MDGLTRQTVIHLVLPAGLTSWSHLLVSDWLPQGAGRGPSGRAVSPGAAASTAAAATSGPAPATALLGSSALTAAPVSQETRSVISGRVEPSRTEPDQTGSDQINETVAAQGGSNTDTWWRTEGEGGKRKRRTR